MTLKARDLPFEVPSYSLTGDVLSFQRCGMQYRYYNGSELPPSRPVQMWTGEFVHGVLEEAYRHWSETRAAFPWPHTPVVWPPPTARLNQQSNDIGDLGARVEARLAAKGLRSRSAIARGIAYQRVEAAINLLCPHLFPLITAAEEPISGTREMPQLPQGEVARGTRYELTGVLDVISSMNLAIAAENPLVQIVQPVLPPIPGGEYDLIVDYKAARRPIPGENLRNQYEWQIQTYAWLRSQVPQARPVGAGVLIYINELFPSESDLDELKQEIQRNQTDMVPPNGSQDYYALHTWRGGQPLPALSVGFRLRRAVHVVDVGPQLVQRAVAQIDGAVSQIESSACREHNSGDILTNWRATGADRDCDACDFRHFCPEPAQFRNPNAPARTPPAAPG